MVYGVGGTYSWWPKPAKGATRVLPERLVGGPKLGIFGEKKVWGAWVGTKGVVSTLTLGPPGGPRPQRF